jgi:hypothetical protein
MSWQLTDTNGVGVVRERYWLTFAPGEMRSCTSCHGINVDDQVHQPAPTNTPEALITLLNYWKTKVSIQPAIVTNQGAAYAQVTFTWRPAEAGVTYHVQESSDLLSWSDIATYSSADVTLSSTALEMSAVGSPDQEVTVRDTSGLGDGGRYMRVNVTQP